MEKKLNLARLLGGSCTFAYRGMLLETKDGLVTEITEELTPIAIDGIDEEADQRTKGFGYKITVTPPGKWENLAPLYPYLDMPTGRFIVPVLPISAIDTGTDVLTIARHCLIDGDRVVLETRDDDGVLPAAVSVGTFYYVSVVTADTIKLHDTKAHALAGTDTINFADDGTGTIMLVGQFPLEIYGEDGEVVTFGSAAIVKQPDLDLSSTKTPLGQIEFEAYLQHGKKFSDEDAVFTIGAAAFPGWTIDSEDIPTQSPWVAFANQLAFANTGVDATGNGITIAGHGLVTEAAVYFGTTGTPPAADPALDPERKYFVARVDDDTLTLHLTAAAATAGTGAIDFSSQGTGRHWLTVDNPAYSLLDTKMGVKVSFPVSFTDRDRDRFGVVNKQLKTSKAQASFVAYGLSAQKVLALVKSQGGGARIGRSATANSLPLSIFAAGQFVRINGAKATKTGANWKMTDDRAGEVTFINTRRVIAGVVAPVAVVGNEIP